MTTHSFIKSLWESMPMPYNSGQCPVKCPTDQEKSDTDNPQCVKPFIDKLLTGTWFGYAEVDIRVPPHLCNKSAGCVPYSSIEKWMKPTSLKTCWTIYNAPAENAWEQKSYLEPCVPTRSSCMLPYSGGTLNTG